MLTPKQEIDQYLSVQHTFEARIDVSSLTEARLREACKATGYSREQAIETALSVWSQNVLQSRGIKDPTIREAEASPASSA